MTKNRNRRISITVSKQLRDIKKQIVDIVEDVAKQKAEELKAEYDKAPYDQDSPSAYGSDYPASRPNDINVECEKKGDSVSIKANGQDLFFVEFGTGPMAETRERSDFSEEYGMGQGAYRAGSFGYNEEGWAYSTKGGGKEGQKIHPMPYEAYEKAKDDRPQLHWTQGTPPANAFSRMYSELVDDICDAIESKLK